MVYKTHKGAPKIGKDGFGGGGLGGRDFISLLIL